MQARAIIRNLYLYLFALLGLIFLSIGGIRILDMGLRAFVFTQAEQEQRLQFEQPPMYPPLRYVEGLDGRQDLTPEEREQIRHWMEEYRRWEERRATVDPIAAQRHREAASSLAMILVGLPLYLFHWRLIRRETPV